MANEDLFEFSAKMDIEVEKSSLDKVKGVLDSFYKKYNDRTMKVDTSDMVKAFRGGVLEMQKLYDQGVKEMSKNGFAWWESEDGVDEMFNSVRTRLQEILKDAKMAFSDGSIFSVLDDTLEDVFNDKISKGITVVAADLGDRVQFLKNEITDAITQLNSINAIQSSHWGVYGFSGDEMTNAQLKNRISMLKKMADYQAELELFNGKKFEYEIAPVGMTTSGLTSKIKEMEGDLESLQKYNLQTTEQLKRRKELIDEAQESWQWDDDDHAKAKEQIHDDYVYQSNIESLQNYIDRRKEVIRKLQDNEAELFSVDGISNYVNDANVQITRLESRMQELVDLRNGKTVNADHGLTGDLTEVVDGLGKVEQAVRDVIEAFKPLTDALSSEDSAISALVKTSISDLQKLQEEVQDTFKNIEALSKKEFVNQTVISQAAPRNNALSTYRNEAKTLLANMVDLAKQINNVNISGYKDKVGLTTADQMFANNFLVDSSKILKDIQVKKNTVDDIVNIYEGLLEQLEYLQSIADKTNKAIDIRNNSGERYYSDGKMLHRDYTEKERFKNVDVSATKAAKSVKELDNMISSSSKGFATKDNVSESLDELEALKTKSAAIFNDLKDQLVDLFDFSKLNPDYSYIESITENIYQKFVDLQDRISKLGFTINATSTVSNPVSTKDIGASDTADSINDEQKAAQNVDDAFTKAAIAKDKFSDANREAAKTAEQTVKNAEDEADALKEVAKKAEQSAGKIVEANDKFDKIKYINDIDENGVPQPRSKVTIGTDKKENAYETTTTFLEYDEESGEYIQKVETIIKDFKKRSAELKRETAKIELAKKTVAKFLSQFNNKTAGHGSDIEGYTDLKEFEIKNLDDIESAMQKMIDLDTKYNELTRDFRKGTKSMNPFVNAFNSMDEMRNKVKSAQIDFENLTSPTNVLRKQVEDLPELLESLDNALTPDENGAINIENIAKAYGNLNEAIKQVNSSIGLQSKEEKSKAAATKAEEDRVKSLYQLYEKQAQSASKISEYRQKLNSGNLGKEEARLIATQLHQEKEQFAAIQQQIKGYGDLYQSIEQVATITHELYMAEVQRRATEEKQSVKEKEKELNALYKERSTIITRIIQLNKKLATLKTDKAKDRAKKELDSENANLARIDKSINQYDSGLVNKQKLQKQDKRLTDSNIDIKTSKEEKQQIEEVNKALQKRKEIHEEILKLQKQLDSTDGYQSQSVIKKEIDALKARELAYTRLLATYKDNSLQRMVTEQDNAFREKDDKTKTQKRIKDAAAIDNAAVEAQKEDYEEVLSLVKQLHDAQTALHKINVDQSNAAHTAEREKEIAIVKELSKLLKEVYGIDIKNLSESLDKSSLLTQEQKNKLLQQERDYREEIVNLTAKASDKAETKTNKEAQNYGKTIYNREKRNYDIIRGNISNFGDIELSDDFLNKVKDYEIAYKKFEDLRKKFEKSSNAQKDAGLKAQFNGSAIEVEKLRKELMETFKEYQKFESISGEQLLGEDILDTNKFSNAKAAMMSFADEVTNGKFQFEGFNAAGTEMYGIIDKGNGVIENVTVALNGATNGMKAFISGSKQVTTSWSKLGNELKDGFKQIVGQYIGFHELWQAIRKGVGYVREIDLALTELRKVTSETDLTYKGFLRTMSQTGSTVGATVADLTSSAADWARLGYSIEEAGQLAKNTAILMNVSEFDDVTEATDTLISALQAFKNEETDVATYSMQIIDEMNEVGNAYAISTSDLANSLTRSSAALAAANNSLEESIAMTTAANTIIQDPEAVGNALKVVSMRIRGVKTELEAAGEDTEGMVTNTAKLQEKIMALTSIDGNRGINILANDGNFKSTYQILLEISKVWDKIDDTSQAGLLEVLAGKVRGSTVAALLSGGDIMEDAFKSASNASGSAQEELDKYLDSIDGKITQFNNSLQTMWMNLIDSDFIKRVVDMGTGVIKFLDTVPGKITAIITALAGFSKFKGFSILGLGKEAQASLQNYKQTFLKLSSLKLIGGEYDSTNITAYANAVDGLTAKKQAEMLATMGLNKVQIIEIMNRNKINKTTTEEILSKMNLTNSTKKLTTTTVEAAIATQLSEDAMKDKAVADFLAANGSKKLTAELVEQMVKQKILTAEQAAGILVNNKLAFSWKALGESIKLAFASNPVGFVLTLVTTISSVVIPAIEHFTKSAEELKQEVEELQNTYESAKNTFSENLTALTESGDPKLYDTLEDEFKRLARGVDEYGNNISLTSDQYERYEEICEKIVGVNPKIAAGYDSATKAIGNNVNVLSELIELQKIQQRQNVRDFLSDENIETLGKEAIKTADQAHTELSNLRLNKEISLTNMGQQLQSGIVNLAWDNEGFESEYGFSAAEVIPNILKKLGYDEKEIKNIVDEYTDKFNGIISTENFYKDFGLEMFENRHKFGLEDGTNPLGKYLESIIPDPSVIDNQIKDAEKKWEEARNGLIETLLQVPFGEDVYDKLTDADKNLIVSWIKNSEIFKIDPSASDEVKKSQLANSIKIVRGLVNDFADENMRAAMDGIANFDKKSGTAREYLDTVRNAASEFWKAIGEENNEYGFGSVNDIIKLFGIDIDANNNKLAEARKLIYNRLKDTVGFDASELMNFNYNTMTQEEMEAFLNIPWDEIGAEQVKSIQDVWALIRKTAKEQDITSVKTYSTLVKEIESYNEVLSQTEEIVSDNTLVTQEYKDSLIALGISEEDLNECFDENNKLVVKDAKALNNLVKTTKKNTAQNIKLAKSQARLEYYELYKEMKALTGGTGEVDGATKSYINSLYEQMTVLQRTIAKYSLLEAELLGAANAYQELEAAQAADEAMDYGSKAEELVNVLAEAFNTAQLGTEAARVAFEGIIPDDVIDKTKTLDEQMQQAYEYFTKGPVSQLFTIKFDKEGEIENVEMTKENVQKFTESLIGTDEDSIFQGTWDEFNLNPAIKNLDDFAKAIGATREVAFAYLTELERYDIGNIFGGGDTLLDQLMGDNLDYQLQKAIQTAAEVEKKLAEGTLKATDKEYQDAQKQLEAREEQTVAEVTEWSQKQQALEAQKKKLVELQKQYEETYETGGDTSQIEKAIEDTSKEIDLLLVDIRKLEEPTEFVLNVAMSEAKENINELKDDFDDLIKQGDTQALSLKTIVQKIDANGLDGLEDMGFVKGEDGKWGASAKIEGWFDLDEETQLKVLEYINMIESEHQIDLALGEDTPTIEETIKTIAETLERIANVLDPNYTLTVETTEAEEKTSTFKSMWDGIESKSVTLTTFVETVQSFFKGARTSKDGADNVNGNVHFSGTGYSGGTLGAPKTETSLVGELGPEILVRGNRWTTVGENGAEFTQVRKGDIIFNHKQTKSLLKNGYVTGRGKAYAGGTWSSGTISDSAFKGVEKAIINTFDDAFERVPVDYTNAVIDTASKTIKSLKDAYSNQGSDDDDAEDIFEETFDWIEVRLEELNEELSRMNAELENAIGYVAQNGIIDKIIAKNKELYSTLDAAATEYNNHAANLLLKVDKEYRDLAQNGAIKIEDFIDASGVDIKEEQLEAIKEYREWTQKGADATQRAEEVLTEIQSLAKQAFDNIATEFDNKISIHDSKISQFQANNELLETDKGFASEGIYEAIITENEAKQKLITQQRDALQAELDSGKIKKYSDAWYDAVNTIAECDEEIINLNVEIENLQDNINELHWEKFDLLIKQFQAVSDEAGNLLDILATKDAVDKLGNWTDDGVTSLGLLAQQMEEAEMAASKYKQEIEYLNKNWKSLGYTQEEYVDKLEELKSGQYDAINSYHDAKDAIVDLNKTRVDAIKDGIEKEIEAHEELINKQKELLEAKRDNDDFDKSVTKQQKNISDIQRKLDALEFDTSISAAAKRKQLEAELAEAKYELQEIYSDRSYENEQDRLDQELEDFQDIKDKEIEGWEKYLENIELVVSDSLAMVQESTKAIYATLTALGQQYGLDITNSLTNPWLAGEYAIQNYGAKLNVSLTTLSAMFGLTVDEFAAKLGLTTDALISSLDITVAQMAESLGLTNEQLAEKLGLTVSNLNSMMGLTIEELAAKLGITLPALAEKLGTTTAGLVGNLDMTMAQFAGKMGLTVEDLAEKFGLSAEGLADKLGMTYQDLMNPFGLSMSATVDALKSLEEEYANVLAGIEAESKKAVDDVNSAMNTYQNNDNSTKPTETPTTKPTTNAGEITVGGRVNAGNATIYADSYGGGAGKQYYGSDPIYTVLRENNGYVLVRHHKLKTGYTGWFKKGDLKAYATGTLGTDKDQLAWIDELGLEELVMHAGPNGRLQYLTKGSSVIPHDITENLMQLGQLDPSEILKRNAPQIGMSPSVVNNDVNITMEIAEVVHIDHVDHDTLPDLTKAVRKEMDSYMLKVNNAIRSKVR